MHTRDEHVRLPSLARRIVLLADLMGRRQLSKIGDD
jgi:acetylornithine deacetylase/succinyl-diaminopimelate desuccinylase-like protein